MATVKELQTQLNAANAKIKDLEDENQGLLYGANNAAMSCKALSNDRRFELIKAQLQAKTLSGFDDMSTSQVRCIIRNADRILVEMGE